MNDDEFSDFDASSIEELYSRAQKLNVNNDDLLLLNIDQPWLDIYCNVHNIDSQEEELTANVTPTTIQASQTTSQITSQITNKGECNHGISSACIISPCNKFKVHTIGMVLGFIYYCFTTRK